MSTVDSGNLVGHLLTLREGMLQLADQRILPPQAITGLAVTLRGLISAIRFTESHDKQPVRRAPSDGELRSCHHLEQLQQELLATAPTLDAGSRMLSHLATTDRSLIAQWTEHSEEQVRWWSAALLRQIQTWFDEVTLLAPLATLTPAPHSLWHSTTAQETGLLFPLHSALERINGNGTLRDIAQLGIELAPLFDGTSSIETEHRDWLTQLQQRISEISDHAAAGWPFRKNWPESVWN